MKSFDLNALATSAASAAEILNANACPSVVHFAPPSGPMMQALSTLFETVAPAWACMEAIEVRVPHGLVAIGNKKEAIGNKKEAIGNKKEAIGNKKETTATSSLTR